MDNSKVSPMRSFKELTNEMFIRTNASRDIIIVRMLEGARMIRKWMSQVTMFSQLARSARSPKVNPNRIHHQISTNSILVKDTYLRARRGPVVLMCASGHKQTLSGQIVPGRNTCFDIPQPLWDWREKPEQAVQSVWCECVVQYKLTVRSIYARRSGQFPSQIGAAMNTELDFVGKFSRTNKAMMSGDDIQSTIWVSAPLRRRFKLLRVRVAAESSSSLMQMAWPIDLPEAASNGLSMSHTRAVPVAFAARCEASNALVLAYRMRDSSPSPSLSTKGSIQQCAKTSEVEVQMLLKNSHFKIHVINSK